MTLGTPLTAKAKNGTLRAIGLGRISTAGQDAASIDAQHAAAKAWLAGQFPGPIDVRQFGEQVSGWVVDRDMMDSVNALIETGEWDLVLVNELREMYRNPKMQWQFVQRCVDAGVRFVSITDGIDTADPQWERSVHIASLLAGMAVPETRERIIRKASHAFAHGGMVMKVKFSYRKLSKEEAESGKYGPKGLRVAKLSEWTPTVLEMRRRVIAAQGGFTKLGDWLNDEGIPPGPYVTSGRWNRRNVIAFLSDPILSGQRTFRKMISKMVYRTGKPRPLRNPAGPLFEECPELAHLSKEEHAPVLAINAALKNKNKDSDHPLNGRPRKDSLFPGQHAVCGYCGGVMYRYGKFIRCQNTLSSGARTCWNHVQPKIEVIHEKVLPWIFKVLSQHPQFRDTVAMAAWTEFQRLSKRRSRSGDSVTQTIAALQKQCDRLVKAIRKVDDSEDLIREYNGAKKSLAEAQAQQRKLTKESQESDFISLEDVRHRLDDALTNLAQTSFEFACLLRKIIPRFEIVGVQQLNCPQVRPRAKLTLQIEASGESEGLCVETVIDLFDAPKPIANLAMCVEAKLTSPNKTLKQLAQQLGINHMTIKRALDYARLMQSKGMAEPFEELLAEPTNASRWTSPRRDPPTRDGADVVRTVSSG